MCWGERIKPNKDPRLWTRGKAQDVGTDLSMWQERGYASGTAVSTALPPAGVHVGAGGCFALLLVSRAGCLRKLVERFGMCRDRVVMRCLPPAAPAELGQRCRPAAAAAASAAQLHVGKSFACGIRERIWV